MGLNILSVAYPLTRVGTDAVGGSEQILTLMDQALTRAGHNSIVVAVEGSEVTGTLAPTPKWTGRVTDPVRHWAQRHHRIVIERVLRQMPIDLVHMHSLDFHRYLPKARVPVLVTLHLPPAWYPDEIFRNARPNTYYNCVSASQRRSAPRSSMLVPTVPNGIDIGRFQSDFRKRNHVLALGRICPEKGYHLALDAAKRAGVELLLAGEVLRCSWHLKYFKNEIVPRLNSRRKFVGPAGFERKRRLLTEARCLLVPSLVPETSSLVTMEAMACGTPVIAFPSGALAELIDNGRTGFLVNDEYEMAEAIKAVGTLDPEDCREAAHERFSATRMVHRYMDRYSQILEHRRSAAIKPLAVGSAVAGLKNRSRRLVRL